MNKGPPLALISDIQPYKNTSCLDYNYNLKKNIKKKKEIYYKAKKKGESKYFY